MIAKRETVDLICPGCRRWLAEAKGYGRAVCPNCGWEIIVADKGSRYLTEKRAAC